MSYDPTRYSIMVRKEHMDGEDLFVGRVSEFPDVEVFEDTYGDAYDALLEVINNLKEGYTQISKEMPEPLKVEDEYSGKMTLRMTKSLHAKVARKAMEEDVSVNMLINQYIVSGLTEAICVQTFNDSVEPVAKKLLRSNIHHFKEAFGEAPSSKLFAVSVENCSMEDNEVMLQNILPHVPPHQFRQGKTKRKRTIQ